MPAIDQCEDKVVRALAKEGWVIENAPYKLATYDRTVYIDLRLHHGSNGNDHSILVVEVKCFPDRDSTTRDLYTSLGQYLIYQALIELMGIDASLFLAIPSDVFTSTFDDVVLRAVSNAQVKLLIVDIEKEIITKWIR